MSIEGTSQPAKLLKAYVFIASQNRFHHGDFITSVPNIPPGHTNVISQFVRDVCKSLKPTLPLKSALNKKVK